MDVVSYCEQGNYAIFICNVKFAEEGQSVLYEGFSETKNQIIE